jgi:hypothetical protein
VIPLFLPALVAPAPQVAQAPLESGKSRFILLEQGATVLLPLRLPAGEHNLRIVASRLATSGDIAFRATVKSATGQQLEQVTFFDNAAQSTERVTLSSTAPSNVTLELAQTGIVDLLRPPGAKVLLKIYLDTEDEPEPEVFVFSPERPKLAVLVHGITSKPQEAPAEGIGTSGHTRWYWGFDFIKALLGRPVGGTTLWQAKTTGRLEEKAIVGGKTWTYLRDAIHFPHSSKSDDLAPVLTPDTLEYFNDPGPDRAAMVTFRDGSKHLMPQVGATIDQVYETYQAVYGKVREARQPQIYFVAHSFGGIVCRAILSNPDGPDLFGNRLTAQQRERADFLRARTVLVATLSTPHEGSPIPDQAQDIAAYLRSLNRPLSSVLPLLAPVDRLTNLPPLKQAGFGTDLVGKARGGLQKALDGVSGERDSLEDIQRMPEYNRGILAPSKATRPDGSSVPIYTMGGRNPGGLFFDRPRGPLLVRGRMLPHNCLDVMSSGRPGSDAGSLYLIQGFLHHAGYGREGKRPWGTAVFPDADIYKSPYQGVGAARARSVSEGIVISDSLISNVLNGFLQGNPYTNGRDGENDSDGFVGFDSSHGLSLSGGTWCRVYGESRYGEHQPWDTDNHGSLTFNVGNALWIYNELLERASPTAETRPTERWGIKVEIVEVKDSEDSLDTLSDADFSLAVRIAGQLRTKDLPDGEETVKNATTFTKTGLLPSVILVRIDVTERDSPDPDDFCAISPVRGRDNTYVFFDRRTNRVYGDATGTGGQILTVEAGKGIRNRARVKFRLSAL